MDTLAPLTAVKGSDLADWVLSRGRNAITTYEASELLHVPKDQVRVRLRAPAKRGHWVSPARGLWVPVPPQFRLWGGPPVLEYLDSWMSYLGADYYVGWLSAAAIHGASHQAAQVTQVATSKTVQSRQIGRSRTEFYLRCGIREVPTTLHRVASGDVPVATPEATVLGISADVRLGAGIDNVANIIIELAAENALNGHRLAHIAHLFPASAVRRTGWMLENFTDLRGLGELKSLSGALPPTPSVLSPDSPRAGKVDRDWNLQINARLDPDV